MIDQVLEAGRRLESFFELPQDMEWTFWQDRFYVLQSRAITTALSKDTDDKRTWYLSLHRSYDNLKALYDKIEHRLIPEMIQAAEDLGRIDLSALSPSDLCAEIDRRQAVYDHWVKVYWADFIPFAHGIRLFGQVYNDAVKPADPYEFMTLLENTGLKSVRRNTLLEELAECIRTDPGLARTLTQHGRAPADHRFSRLLADFIDEFGDLSCTTGTGNECQYGDTAIIRILLAYAPAAGQNPGPRPIPARSKIHILRRLPRTGRPMPKTFCTWAGKASGSGMTTTSTWGASKPGSMRRSRKDRPDCRHPKLTRRTWYV